MLDRLTGLGKAAARRGAAALALAVALAACAPGGPGSDEPATGPALDGGAVEVALLLPLGSDEAGGLARGLENAARLAAADVRGAEVRLKVHDTGGTAAGAAAAAGDAVAEGADVILGPIFADAAAAAGRAAQGSGVQVLSFSNNARVAGGNLFVFGTTFETGAARLTAFAAARGAGALFVVAADSPAERQGRDAVLAAADGNGARVVGETTFPLSQDGLIAALPRIAREIAASGATAVVLTSSADGALPLLVELLPEHGVDWSATRLLGLQRLDVPASALTLTGVQGAWFALPDPALATQFAARYEAAYGTAPSPIAFLGYDAVAAVGALAAQGEAPTRDALLRPSGFAGTGGVFRLTADGDTDRALAIAEVRNRQAVLIDPAPRSFPPTQVTEAPRGVDGAGF